MGQLIGAGVEIAVGETLLAEFHCHPIGVCSGDGLKALVDEVGFGDGTGRLIPVDQQQTPFFLVQQIELADSLSGMRSHIGQKIAHVAQQANDGVVLVEAGVVGCLDDDLLARACHHSQGIIGLLVGLHILEGDAGLPGAQSLVNRIILENENGLEQRRARGHIAPFGDLDQRRIFVLAHLELPGVNASQPVTQSVLIRHQGAQG